MAEVVALVDYGAGNLHSVANALKAAGAAGVTLTSDPEVVRAADRIVLPGVGSFRACAEGLRAIPHMVEAMAECVLVGGAPFLGICVGMQLLATRGLEHGDHPGLGWIAGTVAPIAPGDLALKIPQMGWNELRFTRPHPLAAGIAPGAHAYFVHGYALTGANEADVVATTDGSALNGTPRGVDASDRAGTCRSGRCRR